MGFIGLVRKKPWELPLSTCLQDMAFWGLYASRCWCVSAVLVFVDSGDFGFFVSPLPTKTMLGLHHRVCFWGCIIGFKVYSGAVSLGSAWGCIIGFKGQSGVVS